jgi:hypothetical protein
VGGLEDVILAFQRTSSWTLPCAQIVVRRKVIAKLTLLNVLKAKRGGLNVVAKSWTETCKVERTLHVVLAARVILVTCGTQSMREKAVISMVIKQQQA